MVTTITDVRDAFAVLQRAWKAAGLQRTVSDYDHRTGETHTLTFTADNLGIQEGSQTYGRAFRLYYVHPVTGGHYQTQVPEYLGWTRSEAELTLRAMAAALFATLDR